MFQSVPCTLAHSYVHVIEMWLYMFMYVHTAPCIISEKLEIILSLPTITDIWNFVGKGLIDIYLIILISEFGKCVFSQT